MKIPEFESVSDRNEWLEDVICDTDALVKLEEEYGITEEPSTQCGRGGDFFFFTDEEGNEWSGNVDYEDEMDEIAELYEECKNRKEFEERLVDYFYNVADSCMVMTYCEEDYDENDYEED